jgi:transmembrane sensor
VELSPVNDDTSVRIDAGKQAQMSAGNVGVPEAAGLASDGWTHGVLYAEKTPLGILLPSFRAIARASCDAIRLLLRCL